jgi:hypothetical protein
MASKNAEAVAFKVIEKVRKGEKVNLGKIILSQGYGKGIAKHPRKVTETKSFQNIVNPALKRMEKIRSKALEGLEKKNVNKEKYSTLLSGVDVLTKNIQLLGGKATENVGVIVDVSERIHNKYSKLSNNSVEPAKQVLNNGSTEP